MIRANETAAAFMSDEDAIRDRKQFVRNLGIFFPRPETS